MTQAVGYLRTSSAANVGGDKDSEARQRAAIEAYAAHSGISIGEWFYDAAVSGADPVETRAGFAAMLEHVESSGVRLVIVEDSSRLARSVLAGELAVALLTKRGVRVLASNGDDLTESDDPMRIAMRQMASVFSEAEKRRLVLKLKHARERKREATGRCEGVRGYDMTRPELVAEAHALASTRSLRAIAAELAQRGYRTAAGKPFSASQVSRLLAYNVTAPSLLEGVRSDADAMA